MSLRPLRNFMKHRIGLIGFGSMGTNHARIISSLANVNFVGIFDSNIKNTHSSYKFYSSVDQLISDSDLLIIATPTSSHHKFAEYCINKNKHVLVEKPYSLDIEELQKFDKLSKKTEVFIKIGLLEKYNPVVQFLKTQKIDDIYSIKIERLSPSDQMNRNKDHVLLDLSIHDFSILQSLTGTDLSQFEFEFFFKNDDPHNHVDIVGRDEKTNITISTSKLSQKKVRTLVINSSRAMYIANLANNSVEILTHEGIENLNSTDLGGFKEKIYTTFPIIEYKEPLLGQIENFLIEIENKNLSANRSELTRDISLHNFLISNI